MGDDYVRYIDRTREYYLAEGYTNLTNGRISRIFHSPASKSRSPDAASD